MIATHRRVGCMKRKLDSYSSYRDIHLLDLQEDEINRYHMDLKKVKELEEQVKFLVEIVKPRVVETTTVINVKEDDDSK